VNAGQQDEIAALERRRRLSLRAAGIALAIAVLGFPLGMTIGGSENADTFAGMLLFAAIAGLVAAPWIVRAWQGFMRRRMIAAVVAGRSDIRHIDGEKQQKEGGEALSSNAFELGAFHDCGLVEAFESAGVGHILTGQARNVPFAIAEVNLLDAKGYPMFGGVLASFRLSRPRAGLTIVARDRGILGNLIARAGSAIERLPLEDPTFEGVFEAYGTDQVGGRVVLTTTMLERLKAVDQLAHAHGFACAFLEEHLLIAFAGMNWRCPAWRIVTPVNDWLQGYAAWLTGLVDLPADIVRTLNLAVAPLESAGAFAPAFRASVPISGSAGQVLPSGLWKLLGEGGMSLIYVASGSMFGGVALFGAWYGLTHGYSAALFWYFWGLISAGVLYGAYAIALGLRELARLAWRWKAPLRTLKRP
jgi:hypothetical protein